MIDPRTRQRWQSIADELGLPVELSPASEHVPAEPPAEEMPVAAIPPPAVPAQPELFAEPVPEAPPDRGQRRRRHGSGEDEQSTPKAAAPVEDAIIEDVIAELTTPPVVDIKDSPSIEVEPAPEGAPPREGAPRGRRRGRRGSKGPRVEAIETDAVGEAEAAEEASDTETELAKGSSPTEENEERSRRRGRGRGKKPRREREPVDVAEDEEERPSEEVAQEEEADDDDGGEIDDLSNWSAPSWNDLIDSLYRPDR